MTRVIGQDISLTAQGEAIEASRAATTLKCASCLKPLRPKRARRRFCCDRCRLLYWAVGALIKAMEEGKADGLRPIIEELKKS